MKIKKMIVIVEEKKENNGTTISYETVGDDLEKVFEDRFRDKVIDDFKRFLEERK